MKRIGLLLSILFFISSCEDKYRTVPFTTLSVKGPDHLSDSLIKDTITGTSFYRLHGQGGFGTVYNFYIPDSLKDKYLNIVFSGKARTNYAHSAASICARPIDKEGKPMGWYGGNLKYHFTDINAWCPFKDSILLKLQGWLEPYYCINVFTFLPGPTKENFDIDSLQIQFKVKN